MEERKKWEILLNSEFSKTFSSNTQRTHESCENIIVYFPQSVYQNASNLYKDSRKLIHKYHTQSRNIRM